MPDEAEMWIVATDLDGTLLDHDSYSWQPAARVLTALKQSAIPLTIVTSKTRVEVETLRRALGNTDPFIVENGGALIDDNGRTQILSASREDILKGAHGLRLEGFRFTGFADMTVAEIQEHTGLSAEDAHAASMRETSEPIIWQDSEEAWARFSAGLRDGGFATTIGGRFRHITGRISKASALATLLDRLESSQGHRPGLIALGDSQNDAEMLQFADIGIWIRKPEGATPAVALKAGGRCSIARGPQGWAQTLSELLEQKGIMMPNA